LADIAAGIDIHCRGGNQVADIARVITRQVQEVIGLKLARISGGLDQEGIAGEKPAKLAAPGGRILPDRGRVVAGAAPKVNEARAFGEGLVEISA